MTNRIRKMSDLVIEADRISPAWGQLAAAWAIGLIGGLLFGAAFTC